MTLLTMGCSHDATSRTEMGSGAREKRANRAGLFAREETGVGNRKNLYQKEKRKERSSKRNAQESLGAAARQPWL